VAAADAAPLRKRVAPKAKAATVKKTAAKAPAKKKAAARMAPVGKMPVKKAAASQAPVKKRATAKKAAAVRKAAPAMRKTAPATRKAAAKSPAKAAAARKTPARKAAVPARKKAAVQKATPPAATKKAAPRRATLTRSAAKTPRRTTRAPTTRKVAAAPKVTSVAPVPQSFVVNHLNDADFKADGLRPYALYRDLGIAAATSGLCQAHVIRFVPPCTDEVRKRHLHETELQLVYVLQGWIKNEFEGHGEQMMSAGSCWLQPSGIRHTVLDYSADCEVLEIIIPADFKTGEV
jgi:uncharacterized RmlC-like cupin family protein